MKRARLLLVLSLLCAPSFTSVVAASPTLCQPESNGVFKAEDDPDSRLEGWWHSFLDNVFGMNRQKHGPRYYPGDADWGYDPGDGDWDHDHGDGDWDHDDVCWDHDFGDGDWGHGGPGYVDTDTGPTPAIPAPGAIVLGSIGLSFVGWLRRRRTL